MQFVDSVIQFQLGLIPQNATYLKQMFKNNSENPGFAGISSIPSNIVQPRLRAFGTVLVAFLDAASYGASGILQGGAKVAEIKFDEALDVFAENLVNSCCCTALVICNLAYASLGILFGATIFVRYQVGEVNIPDALEAAQRQISHLDAEIKRLQRENTGSNEALEKQVEALKKQIEDLEGDLSKTRKDQDEELQLKQEKIEDLEAKIAGKENEVEKLEEKLNSKHNLLVEASSANSELRSEIAHLRDLREEIRKLKDESSQEALRVESALAAKQEEIKILKQNLAEAEGKVSQYLSSAKGKSVARKKELTREEKKAERKKDLGKISTRIEEAKKNQVDALELQVTQLKKQIDEKNIKISEMEKLLDAELESAVEKVAELEESENKLEGLEKASLEQIAQLNVLEEKKKKLKGKIQSLKEELQKLKKTNELANGSIQNAQKTLEITKKELKVLQAANKNLEMKNKNLEMKNKNLEMKAAQSQFNFKDLVVAAKKDKENVAPAPTSRTPLQPLSTNVAVPDSNSLQIKSLKQQLGEKNKEIEMLSDRIAEMKAVVVRITEMMASLEEASSRQKVYYEAIIKKLNLDLEEAANLIRTLSKPAELSEKEENLMTMSSFELLNPSEDNPTAAPSSALPYSIASLVLPLWNAVKTVFVDGEKPWKANRYATIMTQLRKGISSEMLDDVISKLKELEGQSEAAKAIAIDLTYALQMLFSPEAFSTPKDQYHAFQASLRKGLWILLTAEKSSIDQKLAGQIFQICYDWFKNIIMSPFNFQMVLYVASKGNKELLKQMETSTLSQKFTLLLEGIKAADDKYKAPPASLNAAKVEKIFNSYDSLARTNAPSQVAVHTYANADGEHFTITHTRTGVPIGPRFGTGKEQPWEMNRISIVPEFLAHIESLREKGETIDIHVHLNSQNYNTQTGELIAPQGMLGASNPLIMQKQKEAEWIQLIIKFAKDDRYKDIISVSLFPMDGDWFKHEIQESKGKNKQVFEDELIDLITQESSPFLFAGLEGEAKKEFAARVIDKVSKQYFYSFKTDDELTSSQMLAFYAFFVAFAKEELALMRKTAHVVHHCADGVDRTMAFLGAQEAEAYHRLNLLGQNSIQEKILGTTLGPALGILKRQLLEERQPLLLAAIEHLEWIAKQQAEQPEQGEEEPCEKETPPSDIVSAGFRLVNVEIAEDKTQSVYPKPALASGKDYEKLIKFEKRNPYALPGQVHMPIFADQLANRDLNVDALLEEELKKASISINGSPAKSSTDFSVECAKLAVTELAFREPLELLKDRYENDDYQVLFINDSRNAAISKEKVTSTGHFALCKKGEAEAKHLIEVSVDISLQNEKEQPQFSYRFVEA